ncbi:MAG TPA: glutaredoxin family protein [Acidimicrobiia bacterium]|nr:glutaredoxin family protein [Acidimicrobiia bacterium]
MTVLFLSRTDCSLCEAALPIVTAVCRRRHDLEVIDVAGTAWEQPYGDRLPVVIVDGAVVLAGHFTKRDVKRALGRPASPAGT